MNEIMNRMPPIYLSLIINTDIHNDSYSPPPHPPHTYPPITPLLIKIDNS